MNDQGKIVIRPAKPYDATKLCYLLERAYLDQDDVYPPIDQARMLAWVTRLLSDGYVLVADKGGRIVGSLALANWQFQWSVVWYAVIEWFFVDKSFRVNGTADGLLRAAHMFADERQVPIVGGISAARDAKVKDRLMRIKGYTYLGGQFLRTPDDGQHVRRRRDGDGEQGSEVGAGRIEGGAGESPGDRREAV